MSGISSLKRHKGESDAVESQSLSSTSIVRTNNPRVSNVVSQLPVDLFPCVAKYLAPQDLSMLFCVNKEMKKFRPVFYKTCRTDLIGFVQAVIQNVTGHNQSNLKPKSKKALKNLVIKISKEFSRIIRDDLGLSSLKNYGLEKRFCLVDILSESRLHLDEFDRLRNTVAPVFFLKNPFDLAKGGKKLEVAYRLLIRDEDYGAFNDRVQRVLEAALKDREYAWVMEKMGSLYDRLYAEDDGDEISSAWEVVLEYLHMSGESKKIFSMLQNFLRLRYENGGDTECALYFFGRTIFLSVCNEVCDKNCGHTIRDLDEISSAVRFLRHFELEYNVNLSFDDIDGHLQDCALGLMNKGRFVDATSLACLISDPIDKETTRFKVWMEFKRQCQQRYK